MADHFLNEDFDGALPPEGCYTCVIKWLALVNTLPLLSSNFRILSR
jgi:hypothetical protein